MEDMALSDCEDSASVGRDVPTDSIAVAIARPDRGGPEWPGTIPNRRSALRRRIGSKAGPCGDGIHREIAETGHPCRVVAPGLVPRGATDRVKTDRRAATLRAREHRSGSACGASLSGVPPPSGPNGAASTRFDSPRQLMRVRGRGPRDQSSGPRRRTGGITKAGTGPAGASGGGVERTRLGASSGPPPARSPSGRRPAGPGPERPGP